MKGEKVRCPRFIQKYIRQLGLKWKVGCMLTKDTGHFFRITSSKVTRRHTVLVHPRSYPGENRLWDWLHELCHASLAERIDVQFSTYYFSAKYTPDKDSWLAPRMNQFYLAAVHVDIWVNELMRDIDPKVADNEQENFARAFKSLVATEHKIISDPVSALGATMFLAEDLRLERDGTRGRELLNMYEPSSREALLRLVDIYKNLPRLTFCRNVDLGVLEKSIQQVAAVLKLPFVPRLVTEKGQAVWIVD